MIARQEGTSIAELLAALTIGSIISLAAVELHGHSVDAALTIDRLELLTDKARIIQRLLHSEITGAGMAPCGATTQVHDWTGGNQHSAAASLPASGGLQMVDGKLMISRFEPDPQYADLRYENIISTGLGTALQLSDPPTNMPKTDEKLLIGDCSLLHKVSSTGGSGSLLTISGTHLDPSTMPKSGWIWRISSLDGANSTTSDSRLSITTISQNHSASGGSLTLTIDGDPVLDGITKFELGFATCDKPAQFSEAFAISNWQSVCAVRASTTIAAGNPSSSSPLTWPLTVTVPIRGRL